VAFFGLYFWQFITCEEYNDTTVRGKYNHKRVSKWSKYLPGGDIFNLRKLFIPINEKKQHWMCIVIFMKEKRIQYYDTCSVGAGNMYMNDVLQYLIDEDKGQGCVKKEKWTLVPSKESVPKQKNGLTVVHSFACLATSYHKKFI
jgi:Ulp1 family protease